MSKSSKIWLREHFSDEYVKRARREGYRSRAAYKLLEIQEKDKLIRAGMTVVDLGAAPGGWSQVAADLVGEQGKVYALDILPVELLPNVTFIQGDFTEEEVLQQLLTALAGTKVDAVLSDMAPNTSGIKMVDQTKSIYLAELALEFACNVLKNNGILLIKVFQGVGFEQLLREMRARFKKVKIRKPEASRARSKELFLLATGYNI